MILFFLAYLGGALTIISPCILPVLPFVFTRAGQPFLRNGLPLLAGMALMFAIVASLAAIGGSWAIAANQYGRAAALILLGGFGLSLLFPTIADRLSRPVVGIGAGLTARPDVGCGGAGSSLLLGIATGLLWAPCPGPILGLVLTVAALQGASVRTGLILLAYALGAATSLALALLFGGSVFQAIKRSLGAGEWIRRGLGVTVLGAVLLIAAGGDTGLLSSASVAGTTTLEHMLIEHLKPGEVQRAGNDGLSDEGAMPPVDGAVAWLNSPPLTREGLHGKVVLIDFGPFRASTAYVPFLTSVPGRINIALTVSLRSAFKHLSLRLRKI